MRYVKTHAPVRRLELEIEHELASLTVEVGRTRTEARLSR